MDAGGTNTKKLSRHGAARTNPSLRPLAKRRLAPSAPLAVADLDSVLGITREGGAGDGLSLVVELVECCCGDTLIPRRVAKDFPLVLTVVAVVGAEAERDATDCVRLRRAEGHEQDGERGGEEGLGEHAAWVLVGQRSERQGWRLGWPHLLSD